MTKSWPPLAAVGRRWLVMVGNGWQWLAMDANGSWHHRVIWISIYSPLSSHRNQVSFTRQTPSPPAHTSNLGTVGTQYLTVYLIPKHQWTQISTLSTIIEDHQFILMYCANSSSNGL